MKKRIGIEGGGGGEESKNRVLRKMFGPKGEEATESWRK